MGDEIVQIELEEHEELHDEEHDGRERRGTATSAAARQQQYKFGNLSFDFDYIPCFKLFFCIGNDSKLPLAWRTRTEEEEPGLYMLNLAVLFTECNLLI